MEKEIMEHAQIEKYKSTEELKPIIKLILEEISKNKIKKFEFDLIIHAISGVFLKNAEITTDTYEKFYKYI